MTLGFAFIIRLKVQTEMDGVPTPALDNVSGKAWENQQAACLLFDLDLVLSGNRDYFRGSIRSVEYLEPRVLKKIKEKSLKCKIRWGCWGIYL